MGTFNCEHDWRIVPFWHPDRWMDHFSERCRSCGVVRTGFPQVWELRLFLLWRLVVAILAILGAWSLVGRFL